MADENNPNGKNGKVGLVDRVKKDIQAMKVDIPTKAKEQIEGLKDPTKTQVYTSIFRHKHDDTPRNRALGVLSTCSCICTRPRLIAMPCVTATPGAWAGSRFFYSSFSPTPACC